MTTSLLYHAFCVRSYTLLRTEYRDGSVYAHLVLDLCRQMTLSAVAQYLQLNWHLCKDILLSDLRRKKERLRLRHVRRIAIDEIFVRSPHHFLTVVVDLDSGQVLYVGVGKDRSALAPFFDSGPLAEAELVDDAVETAPSKDRSRSETLTAVPEGPARRPCRSQSQCSRGDERGASV